MSDTDKNLKSWRKDGLYHIGDDTFVSVTTVLDVPKKEGLERWKMGLMHEVMQSDPTLSFTEALLKIEEISQAARSRGTTVHSVIESYKFTREPIETVPEALRGFVNAFYTWIEDSDLEIISREKTVVSKQYGYAGTLDLLVRMNKSKRTYVIDAKTGKDIYPEATLQLSAYKQALAEEGIEVDGVAVLLLMEDGQSKFEYKEPDVVTFRALQRVWEWQHPRKAKLLSKYPIKRVVAPMSNPSEGVAIA